ncbi:MAG TPA: pilus assembly protein PilM [Planctomycetota bacterium]|nr:pilus assembly protein PilM [Planctomycetota bacterium]
MAATTVWGLDIGNSAIKAVKMTRVGPACKIEDFDIVEIPPGEDDKDRSARLQTALTNLTANHKFGRDPVIVAVTGNICLHREFQLPPGSDDKLGELVQYEAKQQIPFPLDQVEWGYERYEDPSGVGVALIAVRKNDIQELLTLLKDKCNLNVKGITASPMALYNFIQYEFNPQQTTLILDAGAKGTDFVVMNKRQIYFRTIQIAGREITRALENKFKVPFAKAEDLKKNIAQSPQKDKILQVIEPTLRQLGAEIQRTIGFYKSKARGQRIQQAYLLGHTFRLPGMAESLQAQVREAPFAIVEGLQRVKIDHSCNAEVWNTEFPTMAVAIGLGIQGLGLSELKLNLLPRELVDEAKGVAMKGWVLAAAAVVLAALGVGYMTEQKLLEGYKKRLEELTAIETNAKKFDDKERGITASFPKKKDVLERLSRIARDRGRVTQIFSTVAALPVFGAESKIYMTNLYVSRMPLGKDSLADSTRAEVLTSQNLNGSSSVYGYMAKGVDPITLPAELRPDAPMVVVLSCEVDDSDDKALNRFLAVEEALKALPEVKDLRTSDRVLGKVEHVETPLVYRYEGQLMSTDSRMAPARETKTPGGKKQTVFHAIFRWVDPNDPDLEPVDAPKPAAPAAAPKK